MTDDIVLRSKILRRPLKSSAIGTSVPLAHTAVHAIFTHSGHSSRVLRVGYRAPFGAYICSGCAGNTCTFPLSLHRTTVPSSGTRYGARQDQKVIVPRLARGRTESPPIPRAVETRTSAFGRAAC